MNPKYKSGWFAAAAAFTFIIAAVLIGLLIKMISIDKEQPDIGGDMAPATVEPVSPADVSASDTSDSDADEPEDTEPVRMTLDIGEMTSAFAMTRADMVSRYGGGYTEYTAGSDGTWRGYRYDDKGVAFIFKAGDMGSPDTVAWIECENTVTVLGAYEGMSMDEIAAAWGWTGDWMIENKDPKYRRYIEKDINGITVKACTDWLEGDQQPSYVAITLNK